jgi:hypothetical protein
MIRRLTIDDATDATDEIYFQFLNVSPQNIPFTAALRFY